jgi:YidC/Oxa1 family membrane protein insertase
MVELGVGMLTTLAGAYGGSLGAALLTAGLIVRLGLLPLTLYLAERSRRHAESLRALQPELTALREQHAQDPQALLQAMSDLYQKRGISPVDTRTLLGSLLQLPFLATAYNAVQRLASTGASFRWIADLSTPDLGIAAIVAALTWASVALSSPEGNLGRVLPWILAGVVFLVTSRLMAGLGLYMAASASVGLLQTALLRARRA